jgi:hypothetical protein
MQPTSLIDGFASVLRDAAYLEIGLTLKKLAERMANENIVIDDQDRLAHGDSPSVNVHPAAGFYALRYASYLKIGVEGTSELLLTILRGLKGQLQSLEKVKRQNAPRR